MSLYNLYIHLLVWLGASPPPDYQKYLLNRKPIEPVWLSPIFFVLIVAVLISTLVIQSGFLLGIGLLTLSLREFLNTERFIKNAASTTGAVVKVIIIKMRGPNLYRLKMRFETVEGEVIEFSSRFMADIFIIPFQSGYILPILYDPANPKKARVDFPSIVWESYHLYACLGIGLVIGSLVI